jgi:hypothetical protein
MSWKKMLTVLGVLSILGIAVAPLASAADNLVVIATDAAWKNAEKWVGFLQSKQVPLKHVTPKDFATAKNEKFLVLMGGMDEADGIKAIATEALTPDEVKWVSEGGHGKMFEKADTWAAGQKVILFVGSDWPAAETARVDSRPDWSEAFGEWFDLDMGAGVFHAY